MEGLEMRRPARGIASLLWVAIALSVYGIVAVFGVGGLMGAIAGIPGAGFVGGLFAGLALFSIPTVLGWSIGRRLSIAPVFPGPFRVLVWVGMIGMTIIGAVAVLVDLGVLEIVVR